MDTETLADILINTDFENTTIASLSRQLNVSPRSITRYIRKLKIPYKRNNKNIITSRDKNGRFTFNLSIEKDFSEQNYSSQDFSTSQKVSSINKNTSRKNSSEFFLNRTSHTDSNNNISLREKIERQKNRCSKYKN
jgi:transcriptional antiterminator